jgi:hypothetical protein
MKNLLLNFSLLMISGIVWNQTPNISSWLQNTSITGTYYMSGNSIPISSSILVNCQKVEYSTTSVYVTTAGVPSFPTGPFLDGNPSLATDQAAIYQFPLVPSRDSIGPKSVTTAGNVGVFINGTSLFDYRDGVAWDSASNALCGGPGNSPCPGGPGANAYWNRDAIPAEMGGFDCSKGHPANGNYHHHQNPSAFKLDLNVVSTICNLYDADGLYAMDSTQHSPLIGFAYDGFPIYGAYGFKNENGTGGVTRIKSGYELRNITTRTHWADGTDVEDGPAVGATYILGYFREDYEWISHPGLEEHLDEYNGRFCVTPEYPLGTYCYFATVDANWNSAYPYAVGPSFYGFKTAAKVTSISESTTVYNPSTSLQEKDINSLNVTIFPNPASDLIAIQINDLVRESLNVELLDITGKVVSKIKINAGSTIAYFDLQTLYSGTYIVSISNNSSILQKKITVTK